MDLKWEEFRDAHTAWEAATQAFHKAIRDVIEKRALVDQDQMNRHVQNIDNCKARFEAAAIPFIGG